MMDGGTGDDRAVREEVLFGRVVDGEATPDDWSELERMAGADATVWTRLAGAQRAHARLERAVDDVIAIAELVDVPLARRLTVTTVVGRIREYGGWALAAAIVLVWLVSGPAWVREPGSAGSTVIQAADVGADEHYNRFVGAGLADGSVVREMAPRVVGVRPIRAEGATRYEVLVERGVVERQVVEDLDVLRPSTRDDGVTTFVPEPDPERVFDLVPVSTY